jgi:GntR family transcriptional regulator/MocR family aminotransferase
MSRKRAAPLIAHGVSEENAGEGPLFVRIARAIAAEIRRGRLRPGEALPGTRTLAEQLGTTRNTVVAGFAELEAEGWVVARKGGGTFVSTELPERPPRRFARAASQRERVPARPGFDVPRPRPRPELPVFPRGTIVMAGGVPDARMAPAEAIARAYRRALLGASGRASLSYGPAEGFPALREQIATWVTRARGLSSEAGSVLVTRGSQMAIDLIARTLIAPGERVAVEAIGYGPAWASLERAGAALVSVPVDAHGASVEAIEKAHRTRPLRAVYLTPHHHYPTTVTLSPARRLALLDLCSRERIAIVEDDYDHELHYEGRPVLPLASADTAGVVLYVGTLSKLLAPGLRLGFLVAPEPLVERLARERFLCDRQGDHALEAAAAELLSDGTLDRHARKMQKACRARRDALCEALSRELPGVLSFEPPSGGMALWARVDPGVDVEAWAERGTASGVGFLTGRRFSFEGERLPFVRLGFAALTEREVAEAARRMGKALPTRKRSGPSREP